MDWERGLKHLFVLSSAGKPIFTRFPEYFYNLTMFRGMATNTSS
jgi:hypothetical protein